MLSPITKLIRHHQVWPGGAAVPRDAINSERPRRTHGARPASSRATSSAASDRADLRDSDVDRERLVEHHCYLCWPRHGRRGRAGANIRATVGYGARTRAACMGGHCFQLRANGLKGRVTSRSVTRRSAHAISSHPTPVYVHAAVESQVLCTVLSGESSYCAISGQVG